MQWLPPFTDDSAKVVWESEDAIQSVRYSQDCQTLYITQSKDGASNLFAVELKDPIKKLKIKETKAEAGGSPQPELATRRQGPELPAARTRQEEERGGGRQGCKEQRLQGQRRQAQEGPW